MSKAIEKLDEILKKEKDQFECVCLADLREILLAHEEDHEIAKKEVEAITYKYLALETRVMTIEVKEIMASHSDHEAIEKRMSVLEAKEIMSRCFDRTSLIKLEV